MRVTDLLPAGGVLTGSGPLRAPVTVFADGARSKVREVLPTMRDPGEVAWGMAQLLKAPGLGESSFFEVRFGSFAPGWRAQFNPLGGDLASLWTFVRGVPREELPGYAERAREAFPGASGAEVLEEQSGADPAFVGPGRIAGDGLMACGAAGQGGLEYGARAGLLAGTVAARAVRAGDLSRRRLAAYERAWRRETAAELAVLRWGMAAIRRLSDRRLDAAFGEDALFFLLRGDPRGPIREVGARRAIKLSSRLLGLR